MLREEKAFPASSSLISQAELSDVRQNAKFKLI
jgi:hypothetical protein